MNHEIIHTLTPKEYIQTFLNSGLRIDRRGLNERRQYSYKFGVLDNYSTSASCLLGEGNKVIAVLKSSNRSSSSKDNYLNIVLDNFSEHKDSPAFSNPNSSRVDHAETNLLNFIHKLIEDNLEFQIPNEMEFTLYITNVNCDGNIYDCIAYLILNLFSGVLSIENELSLSRYIKIKRKFTSNTFCVIDDKLIADPTHDEFSNCSYYFTLVKFEGECDEFIMHKGKGDLIKRDVLEQAFRLC